MDTKPDETQREATPRGWKAWTLGAAIGIPVILVVVALAGWFLAGWDSAGPHSRGVLDSIGALGTLGALILTAVLAVATWQLYIATARLDASSQAIASLQRRQFEESGPAAQVRHAELSPNVDPYYLGTDEDDEPNKPDPVFMEVEVANIGGRHLVVDALLVEETVVHMSHDEDGDLVEVDEYTQLHEFSLSRGLHVAGSDNPIPPGGSGTWRINNHGIWWEPEVIGFRVGVKSADGRIAYEPRKTKGRRV